MREENEIAGKKLLRPRITAGMLWGVDACILVRAAIQQKWCFWAGQRGRRRLQCNAGVV
jgi:hypothetical protein